MRSTDLFSETRFSIVYSFKRMEDPDAFGSVMMH